MPSGGCNHNINMMCTRTTRNKPTVKCMAACHDSHVKCWDTWGHKQHVLQLHMLLFLVGSHQHSWQHMMQNAALGGEANAMIINEKRSTSSAVQRSTHGIKNTCGSRPSPVTATS